MAPWYRALWRFAAADGKITAASQIKAARAVGRAFAAPLRALGIQTADVSPWQVEHFTLLLRAALEVLVIGPPEIHAHPNPALNEGAVKYFIDVERRDAGVRSPRGRARRRSARSRSRRGGARRP